MPIRSRKNQYLGINAHLNSILQNVPGEWRSFHANHITHLCDLLERQLPEGYYAITERSLQILREGRNGETPAASSGVPDILIAREAARAPLPTPAAATAPTMVRPAVELLRDTEDELDAVVIYQTTPGGGRGEAVTRIELLSPSNKLPHADYWRYLDKREETLQSGVAFVELDYLHQTRSTIPGVPSYPHHETGAYPYLIMTVAPYPSLEESHLHIYGFRVDEPIPSVPIPVGQEQLLFDFGMAYNYSYAASRYRQSLVDYAQEPLRMDTYSPEDQQRIRRRMEIVRQAVEAGRSLDEGPFPIP